VLMIRLALAATLLVACKGGAKDAPKGGSDVTTPGSAGSAGSAAPIDASAELTPEAKLARYQDCLAAFNAGNAEKLAGCFGPTSVREQIDNVPELSAEGPEKIVEMITQQRAAFPDLTVTPRLIVVSGDTIAALHHVAGKNSVTAGGMKATNKKLGIFEAELVTLAPDGTFARDNFYVDQPTVYHQLGLLANDTSPAAIEKPTGEPELLISKNDDKEAANKALIHKVLEAVSKKDAATIEAAAADSIKLTFHGEKQKVESKKAYMKWMRDTLASTDEGTVTVKGTWAAGDVVVVLDLFTGIPKGNLDDKQIKTNVVQFFRIADGKIVQHEMFVNRLNTAVQLGIVDPDQLMQKLAAAAK
jgi:ketosteroid isomerase-like protein